MSKGNMNVDLNSIINNSRRIVENTNTGEITLKIKKNMKKAKQLNDDLYNNKYHRIEKLSRIKKGIIDFQNELFEKLGNMDESIEYLSILQPEEIVRSNHRTNMNEYTADDDDRKYIYTIETKNVPIARGRCPKKVRGRRRVRNIVDDPEKDRRIYTKLARKIEEKLDDYIQNNTPISIYIKVLARVYQKKRYSREDLTKEFGLKVVKNIQSNYSGRDNSSNYYLFEYRDKVFYPRNDELMSILGEPWERLFEFIIEQLDKPNVGTLIKNVGNDVKRLMALLENDTIPSEEIPEDLREPLNRHLYGYGKGDKLWIFKEFVGKGRLRIILNHDLIDEFRILGEGYSRPYVRLMEGQSPSLPRRPNNI